MTSFAQHMAFIGGGNMASAIMGGLIRQGMKPDQFTVVEPFAEAADKLHKDFGITALPAAGPALARADLVVWAVKPQIFSEAAAPVMAHTRSALHLSVAAGIRTDNRGDAPCWEGECQIGENGVIPIACGEAFDSEMGGHRAPP